jgi:hypothetical protein
MFMPTKNAFRTLAVGLLATLTAHAQTNTTWNGTTNPWNSANWSAGVPNSVLFNAIVNAGTVNLDAAYNINALTVGGTVQGAFALDLAGLLTFSGGSSTLGGGGTFTAGGGIAFLANGTVNAATLILPSGQSATQGSGSNFTLQNTATFNNAGTYTVNSTSNSGITGGSGTNAFNNSGIFNRTTGVNGFTISVPFHNTGTVNVDTSVVQLFSGGTATGGVFNIADGATLQFNGAHTFDAASSITGLGTATARFSNTGTLNLANYSVTGTTNVGGGGGTVNFNNGAGAIGAVVISGFGTANFNGTASPANVTITGSGVANFANHVSTGFVTNNGGGLNIAAGKTFDIGGLLTYGSTSATLGGGGVFNANANVAFSGGGALNGATLNIPAGTTFTHSAFNTFSMSGGAVVNNAGAIVLQNVNNFGIFGSGGTNVINNNGGTLTRNVGTGSCSVSVVFNNNGGTVTVNTGTLQLFSGGTATGGAFNIASGATLHFNGAHTFDVASSITGLGTARALFSNSGTLNIANYSVTGTTEIGSGSAGVVNFNNGAGAIGAVVGSGVGTGNFHGTASPVSVTTTSGARIAFFNDATTATLSAAGDGQVNVAPGKTLNVTGATTMTGNAGGRGRFGGGGVVRASGGFSTSGEGILDTGILTIPAGATATQATFSDHISARNGSTINNAGTWRSQSSATISISGTGPNVFNNSGTLLHDTNAVIAFIDIDTVNTGLITATLGQFTFSRGFVQTAGEFRATTTGQLNFSSGSSAFGVFNGGQITGAGNISGPAVVAGATVAPAGILNFISTRGDLTTTAASIIAIDLGGTTPGAGYDQINENGTIAFTRNGTLAVSFVGGFENTILPTDTFTVLTSNQTTLGQFANVSAGRIATADGRGTFAINTGTNAVVLTDFQPYPEIVVEQPTGTELLDGGSNVDFGTTALGIGAPLTFTIRNVGAGALTGLGVTIGGAHAAEFAVTTPVPGAPAATVAPGGDTTFIVTFTPAAMGLRNATLEIANNDPNEAPFNLTLSGLGNPEPVISSVAVEGGAVPGAGVDPRIPADAVWSGFGIPAIGDAGRVAFLGKWASGEGSGSGIFAGDPAALLVKLGDPATDGAGAPLAGLTFKTLKDPVLSAEGSLAFLAKLKGPGVTLLDDTALYHAAGGTLRLVAREGQLVPGAAEPRIKQFASASVQGANVIFTAKLRPGLEGLPESVTTANDFGAWRWDTTGGALAQIVREGSALPGVNPTPVKSFLLFKNVPGTSGTARGHWAGTLATFLAAFDDGQKAIVDASPVLREKLFATGDATVPGQPGAVWKSLRVPAVPATAEGLAFFAEDRPSGGGSPLKRLHFLATDTAFVTLGDAAPGLPVGHLFAGFKDPVISPGAAAFAFAGTAVLGTEPVLGVWWREAGGSLALAARSGATPPGAPALAQWRSFTSVASTDFGPLFTARLVLGPDNTPGPGGITTATDVGLWGIASDGLLRAMLREGDVFAGKTVRTFTMLSAVSGSNGVRRAFTPDGAVVLRAAYTDGSTEILKIVLP